MYTRKKNFFSFLLSKEKYLGFFFFSITCLYVCLPYHTPRDERIVVGTSPSSLAQSGVQSLLRELEFPHASQPKTDALKIVL